MRVFLRPVQHLMCATAAASQLSAIPTIKGDTIWEFIKARIRSIIFFFAFVVFGKRRLSNQPEIGFQRCRSQRLLHSVKGRPLTGSPALLKHTGRVRVQFLSVPVGGQETDTRRCRLTGRKAVAA